MDFRNFRAAAVLAVALTVGCALAGTPREQDEGIRHIRQTLMFGPRGMDQPVLRMFWATSVGLVTLPFSLPALAYEQFGPQVPEPGPSRDGDPIMEALHEEGLDPVSSAPADIGKLELGRYHAFVIGNDRYHHFPVLRTAAADARAVGKLLADEYGFSVSILLNATRSDIVASLHRMRNELDPGDNLLLYYAGHGHLDGDTREGYWLPVDAEPDDPTNWLANSTIATMIKGLLAKHVLVVADSCFSGSLSRSADIQYHPPNYIHKLARKRARVVLTSGGLEPVQDDGGGANSIFAKYFLTALRENQKPVVEGSALFLRIRQPVMENALQTPEYGPIRLAGHGGGDFLFSRH